MQKNIFFPVQDLCLKIYTLFIENLYILFSLTNSIDIKIYVTNMLMLK